MATNIMETVQKNLGLPPLQKIDPNSQETKKGEDKNVERLTQASLPAVMAALYKLTRTENGTMDLLNNRDGSPDCLSRLFGDQEEEAISKVAAYAGVTDEIAQSEMQDIAEESVSVLRQAVGEKPTYEKVEHYMNGQRHQILVHLPAALQMGQLLHDETMDDRTNKMEGPVSTFMNKLGDTLADGESRQGTF